MDEDLIWKFQTEQIKSKLSRSCGFIAKLRYCIKLDLPRTVYFAIFDSIMRYALQVWDQNKNTTFKEIEKLQNKAIRIMCFKSKLEPTKPLSRDLKILKIRDLLTLNNSQFVQPHMICKLPQNFNKYFKEMRNQHNYNTRGSKDRMIFKITRKTTTYELNATHHRAANDWNELSKNIRLESNDYFSSKLTFTKTLKAYLLSKCI